MTPDELKENHRRLDLIARLQKADGAEAARLLASQSENECVAVARLADQIGRRDVGAVVWEHIRKRGAPALLPPTFRQGRDFR